MRRENVVSCSVSSPANGSAEWPPDDRLRRVTQYSRDANDRTEKPQRTGSPAFRLRSSSYGGQVAADDSFVCSRTRHCEERLRPSDPFFLRAALWIVSLSLAMTACDRWPFS